jgi:hypothetical protein
VLSVRRRLSGRVHSGRRRQRHAHAHSRRHGEHCDSCGCCSCCKSCVGCHAVVGTVAYMCSYRTYLRTYLKRCCCCVCVCLSEVSAYLNLPHLPPLQ